MFPATALLFNIGRYAELRIPRGVVQRGKVPDPGFAPAQEIAYYGAAGVKGESFLTLRKALHTLRAERVG